MDSFIYEGGKITGAGVLDGKTFVLLKDRKRSVTSDTGEHLCHGSVYLSHNRRVSLLETTSGGIVTYYDFILECSINSETGVHKGV